MVTRPRRPLPYSDTTYGLEGDNRIAFPASSRRWRGIAPTSQTLETGSHRPRQLAGREAELCCGAACLCGAHPIAQAIRQHDGKIVGSIVLIALFEYLRSDPLPSRRDGIAGVGLGLDRAPRLGGVVVLGPRYRGTAVDPRDPEVRGLGGNRRI